MVVYLIILRLIHVLASLGWAGGSAIFYLFVEPTAKALEPTGMEFVQYMVTRRRFSLFMVICSTLTVLSGVLLIWQVAGGQLLTWMKTGPGLGFTLGSLAGLVVYLIGLLGVNTRAMKLSKLGAEIKATGGPPSPEQAAELQKLDKEMHTLSTIDFWLVVLSLAFMGTARYWIF